MGLEGLSLRHLLVILVIVALVFGTRKLRGAGADLGAAMKSFRKAMHDNHEEEKSEPAHDEPASLPRNAETSARTAQENATGSAER